FPLMASLGSLFLAKKLTRRAKVPYEAAALALGFIVNSHAEYICSTLVRTSYVAGARVDVATPNEIPFGKSSYVGKYGPRFWKDLRERGLIVFPDTLATSGVLRKVT